MPKIIIITKCIHCPHMDLHEDTPRIRHFYCKLSRERLTADEALDGIHRDCPLLDSKPQELTDGTE